MKYVYLVSKTNVSILSPKSLFDPFCDDLKKQIFWNRQIGMARTK